MHEGRRDQGPQANQPYRDTEEPGFRVKDHSAAHHQHIPQTTNDSDDHNQLPLGILLHYVVVVNEHCGQGINNCIYISADNTHYPASLENSQIEYLRFHFRVSQNSHPG